MSYYKHDVSIREAASMARRPNAGRVVLTGPSVVVVAALLLSVSDGGCIPPSQSGFLSGTKRIGGALKEPVTDSKRDGTG